MVALRKSNDKFTENPTVTLLLNALLPNDPILVNDDDVHLGNFIVVLCLLEDVKCVFWRFRPNKAQKSDRLYESQKSRLFL